MNDPFPKIPPALLNASDIYNYVVKTNMVDPFDISLLKPASYAIRVGSRFIYWPDKEKPPIDRTLSEGEWFTVPPSTIAFITTKEKFTLPPYIAMRFDLKINNAHRGILRGSGPLVDPGFEGHLLVPMHNLTINHYSFHEGQPFLWAEFTKVSPHQTWDSTLGEKYKEYNLSIDADKYLEFPGRKKNLTPWAYITDATESQIVSSISDALNTAVKSAEKAKLTAQIFSYAAALSVLGLLTAIYFGGTNLILNYGSTLQGELESLLNARINPLDQKISDQAQDIKMTQQRLDQLDQKIENVGNQKK